MSIFKFSDSNLSHILLFHPIFLKQCTSKIYLQKNVLWICFQYVLPRWSHQIIDHLHVHRILLSSHVLYTYFTCQLVCLMVGNLIARILCNRGASFVTRSRKMVRLGTKNVIKLLGTRSEASVSSTSFLRVKYGPVVS